MIADQPDSGLRVYSTDAVAIPHTDFLDLRRQGKVCLGVDDLVADTIGLSPRLQPTKTAAAAAFNFWKNIAFLVLIATAIGSFIFAWWLFLVGIAAGMVIVTANGRANQRNLLDAAMVDRDFYEKVRSVRGWEYKMHPDDAEAYLTDSYLRGRKAGEEYLRQNSDTK